MKAILFRLFLCFYANENWSSSTCSRCLRGTGDVQRLVECDGGRDKRCAKCGTLYRDPNAAVNITASAWCFVRHGVWHPLTRSTAEEEKRRAHCGSGLPTGAAYLQHARLALSAAGAPATAPVQASPGPAPVPVPVQALLVPAAAASTTSSSKRRRAGGSA